MGAKDPGLGGEKVRGREERGLDYCESAELFEEVDRAASWSRPRIWRGEVCPRPGPGQ